MPFTRSFLFALPLLVTAAISACQSDDTGYPSAAARAGGAGAPSGKAGAPPTAGHSGGGKTGSAKGGSGGAGGTGTGQSGAGSSAGGHGANAGAADHGGRSSGANGGTAGRGGTGGSVGTPGGGEGGVGGEAGTTSTGGTTSTAGASGVAGETGSSVAGEGGGGNELEFAYVATYLSGVSALSLDPDTGIPTELPGSPVNDGAHIYNLAVDSGRRRLYTVNLDAQLIDFYPIAADGTLPAEPSASLAVAFQPIVVALDPRGRFAYVGGLDDVSVHVFKIDRDTGALVAAGDPLVLASAPAHITPDPSGHFVYVSQLVESGIRGYGVHATGALTEVDHSPFGDTLVHAGSLVFKPGGGFLFSSGGGVSSFAADTVSGELTPVDGSPFSLDASSDFFASNLAVDPTGGFLFASSAFLTEHLSTFAIAPATGALDEVLGSPITVSGFPYSVAVSPLGHRVYAGEDAGSVAVLTQALPGGALSEIEPSPFGVGGLQPELAFAVLPAP